MHTSSTDKLGESAGNLNIPIAKCLIAIRPESVLEYGSGQGKLGIICSQLSLAPAKLIAVQKLFQSGDREILRNAGYTQVIDDDILEFVKQGIAESYDMIVALDVIEHFMYGDGMSIIDYSLYCCKYLLLVWPTKYPQYSSNRFEIHRSSFELKHIADRFDVVYYTQTGFLELANSYGYHLALLRGHMNTLSLRPAIA